MGAVRESFEVSLEAAVELDIVEPDKHAAIIAGARLTADALDNDGPRAALLTAYLNYCKTLGIVPTSKQQEVTVVGSGRIAKRRAQSQARLKAV